MNSFHKSNSLVKFFISIICYTLFWQINFQLLRLLFFTYHLPDIAPISSLNLFKTFWYGIHVDLTLTSYLMILPVLICVVQLFIKSKFYIIILKFYTIIAVFCTSIISFIDLELYAHWGFKINKEFLFYLQFPKEAIASLEINSATILLVFGCLIYSLFIIIFLNRKILPNVDLDLQLQTKKKLIRNGLNVFFLIILVGIGIRGGTNLAPFNPSYVYFSNRPILNHTALNASWNLLYSCILKTQSNNTTYYSDIEAESEVKGLYKSKKCDSNTSILKTKKPNVILVMLEGWTADIVSSLGGVKDVAPNFETLIEEGILFNNFYSSGDRTYKGVPAILSGFPSLPSGSVIKYTSKMEKLNSIPSILNKSDYNSSFLYGGELSFANIKAYIQHCGFSKVTDKFHFSPSDYLKSKWGIHDHQLFERALINLNQEKEPFFSTILTQSSHEPYEVPMETKFAGNHKNERFKNSVYYTDQSLGEFINEAKKQKWYDNTLFIFVADHGKNLPLNREKWSPEMFRIPLLFYGNVIKNELKGTKNENFGSQTDIANTVLNQLRIAHPNFDWSKDLFSCNKNFSFYTFNGGFGWVSPINDFVFDLETDKVFYTKLKEAKTVDEKELKSAKSYMQLLNKRFKEM